MSCESSPVRSGCDSNVVCMFITAGPIIKLCAGCVEVDRGRVLWDTTSRAAAFVLCTLRRVS